MQQPPNPYPQFQQQLQQQPNYTQPQTYYPPQQQWQQPPMPPPKKKSRKRLWLILAAVVLVLAVIIAMALVSPGQSQDTQNAQQAATAIAQDNQQMAQNAHKIATVETQKAHIIATLTAIAAQPTIGLAATHGTPSLGGPISDFIGAYGQPNPHSQPSNGDYNFALYGKPQINDLSITTESNKALSILKDSPTDQGWNESEAIAACLIFTPQDTIYKRSMTLFDGQGNPMAIQRVYYSPSLAKQFTASDFTDENGNQTTPGTFGIVLGYSPGSTTSFLSCSAQVGLQQK